MVREPPYFLRPSGIFAGRLVIAAVVAIAAAFLAVCTDVEAPLVGATFGLAGVILIETALTYLWVRPYLSPGNRGASDEAEGGATEAGSGRTEAANGTAANAEILRDAARVAISTQGIILGLVSFGSGSLTTTAKVGASSLGFGVLVAAILYFLIAYGIPDVRRRGAAAYLYGLTFWALGYALICIAAWLWQQ